MGPPLVSWIFAFKGDRRWLKMRGSVKPLRAVMLMVQPAS